mgnify:CR=1 FL=1
MRHFKIILFFAIILPFNLFSRVITLENKISWLNDVMYEVEGGVQKKLFSFDGVSYDSGRGFLAICSKKIELKDVLKQE